MLSKPSKACSAAFSAKETFQNSNLHSEVSLEVSEASEPQKKMHSVFNFEVAHTHNYVADGIRVHNESVLSFLLPHEFQYIVPGSLQDLDDDVEGLDYVELDFERNGLAAGSTVYKIEEANGEIVLKVYTTFTDENGNLVQTQAILNEDHEVISIQHIPLTGRQFGDEFGRFVTPFLALAVLGEDANPFETIAFETVTGYFTSSVFEFGLGYLHDQIVSGFDQNRGFVTALENAFKGIHGSDFEIGQELVGSTYNYLTTLIMAELFGNGAPDNYASAVLQRLTGNVVDAGVSQLIEQIETEFELDNSFWNGPNDTSLANQLDAIRSVNNIARVAFNVGLDRLLPEIETMEGMISQGATQIALDTVFSGIVDKVNQFLFSSSTGFSVGGLFSFNPVTFLISYAVGRLFDILFEQHPEAYTNVIFDEETGLFQVGNSWSNDGGNVLTGQQMAESYVAFMNQILDVSLAQSHNLSEVAETLRLVFGHYEGSILTGAERNFATMEEAIQSRIIDSVQELELHDGNLMVASGLSQIAGEANFLDEITHFGSYRHSKIFFGITYGTNIEFVAINEEVTDGASNDDLLVAVDQIEASLNDPSNVRASLVALANSIYGDLKLSEDDVFGTPEEGEVSLIERISDRLVSANYYHKMTIFKVVGGEDHEQVVVDKETAVDIWGDFLYLRAIGLRLIQEEYEFNTLAELRTALDESDLFVETDTTLFADSQMTLQIASDYLVYLENQAAYDQAISAAGPDSAYAQGWALTFMEAQRLGLTESVSVEGDDVDNLFFASSGDDTISGNVGDDTLRSFSGNDSLSGGSGDDLLFAGAGDDTLSGGSGLDFLNGGAGSNEFWQAIHNEHLNTDWIENFSVGAESEIDILMLQGAGEASDFSLIYAISQGWGSDELAEVYIRYRPTGEILWVLQDGETLENITVGTDTGEFDLLSGSAEIFDGFWAGIGSAPTFYDFTAHDSIGTDSYLGYGLAVDDALNGTEFGWRRVGSGSGASIELENGQNFRIADAAGASSRNVDLVADWLDGALGDERDNLLSAEDHTRTVFLSGGWGNDTLIGGQLDDWLSGGEGSDVIQGDDGNDTAYIDENDSSFTGGQGYDTLIVTSNASFNLDIFDHGFETFYGHNILATELPEGITQDANDVIFASFGGYSVHLSGGVGNDQLTAGYLSDYVSGGRGSDILTGLAGDDHLQGDTGDDTIKGDTGDDILFGGEGRDELHGGAGDDVVSSGLGGDSLYGDSGDDRLVGDEGDDSLRGGQHDDTLFGGEGRDSLFGDSGDDYLYGGAGDDQLRDNGGDDLVHGGAGNDSLYDGWGDDRLHGDEGDDLFYLTTYSGVNVVFGGSGSDTLVLSGSAEQWQMQETGVEHQYMFWSSGAYVITQDVETVRYSGNGNQFYWSHIDLQDEKDLAYSYWASYPDMPEIANWHDAARHLENYAESIGRTVSFNGLLYLASNPEFADIEQYFSGNDLSAFEAARHYLSLNNDQQDDVETASFDVQQYVRNYADLRAAFGTDLTAYARHFILFGYEAERTDTALDNAMTLQEMQDWLAFSAGDSWEEEIIAEFDPNTSDYATVGEHIEAALAASSTSLVLPEHYAPDNEADDGPAERDLDIDPNQIIYGTETMSNSIVANHGDDLVISDTLIRSAYQLGRATEDGVADTIYGNAGSDTLISGGGNDFVVGGEGADSIVGGNGDDSIVGNFGADILFGSDGNDTLNGEAGADQITGGQGNDLINGGIGNDILRGSEGSDFVSGGTGSDTIGGGDENDTLLGGDGSDIVTGGTGSVTIYGGFGNDDLHGEDGADVVWGDAGDDSVQGGDYNDTLHGGTGNDLLLGGTGFDELTGGNGQDTLVGEWGNDILRGQADDDLLLGQAGDDSLFGGDANDVLLGGAGGDFLDGGLGVDAVSYLSASANGEDTENGIWVSLNQSEHNSFSGQGQIDEATGDTLIDIENLQGSTFNDRLFGDAGNNVIWGERGSDSMVGREGNDDLNGGLGADYLEGGSGQDSLVGGDGNDTINGGNDGATADVDVLYGGNGNDILTSGQTSTPDASYQSSGDSLYGEDGNDTLEGGLADDYLEGGTGHDSLVGGDGDDTIYAATANDNFYSNDTIGGQDGNDVIWGTNGANRLYGGNGNDTINGGNDGATADVDVLYGGNGNDILTSGQTSTPDASYQSSGDSLYGEDGNDTLEGGLADDYLEGGTGHDSLVGGDGDDTIYAATANDNFYSNDTIGGQDGNDVIWGTNGANRLYGGNGNDTIDGGNDGATADVDVLYGGNGNDILTSGQTSTPDASYQSSGDSLYGEDGNDTLEGGLADDYLEGGTGHDSLVGGDGDDTIYAATANSNSFGNDTIGGQDGNDVIWGTNGANRLYGGNGNDTIDGGDDWVSADIDVIYGGNGNDLLTSGQTSTPDSSYQSFGDSLFGESGNDTLNGGLADDYLDGGIGNDLFVFKKSGGTDVIHDFGNGSDLIRFVGTGMDYSDLTIIQDGTDVLIAYGTSNDTIRLQDVELADISSVDFDFF